MTTYNKFDFKIQFPTTIFKVNSGETNQVVKQRKATFERSSYRGKGYGRRRETAHSLLNEVVRDSGHKFHCGEGAFPHHPRFHSALTHLHRDSVRCHRLGLSPTRPPLPLFRHRSQIQVITCASDPPKTPSSGWINLLERLTELGEGCHALDRWSIKIRCNSGTAR